MKRTHLQSFSKSKIYKLNISFEIKKEVLWLEVTVDDALGVEVVKCLHHAGCVEPGGRVVKVTSVPAMMNDNFV